MRLPAGNNLGVLVTCCGIACVEWCASPTLPDLKLAIRVDRFSNRFYFVLESLRVDESLDRVGCTPPRWRFCLQIEISKNCQMQSQFWMKTFTWQHRRSAIRQPDGCTVHGQYASFCCAIRFSRLLPAATMPLDLGFDAPEIHQARIRILIFLGIE